MLLFSCKELQSKGGAALAFTADTLRGYTDTIILTQLMNKDSYGYEINKNVVARTNGIFELKEATLYTAFKRLEKEGLITSYWGDEGVGARRRYYSITEEGRRVWNERMQEWLSTRDLLNALLAREGKA